MSVGRFVGAERSVGGMVERADTSDEEEDADADADDDEDEEEDDEDDTEEEQEVAEEEDAQTELLSTSATPFSCTPLPLKSGTHTSSRSGIVSICSCSLQ
jgi:hypothetical protein